MPLLDKGTDVWRPVAAEPVSDATYRILGSIPDIPDIPDGEQWAFLPGTIVRCEFKLLLGDHGVKALQRVPCEQVEVQRQ